MSAEDGEESTLLVPPTCVMAGSKEAAMLAAARHIPDAHVDHLDRLERNGKW